MKRVSASDAKNNFGGLLEDVAALGCIEIAKHGRVVALVLSPRALQELRSRGSADTPAWGSKHMIPPQLARAAVMVSEPSTFDEED